MKLEIIDYATDVSPYCKALVLRDDDLHERVEFYEVGCEGKVYEKIESGLYLIDYFSCGGGGCGSAIYGNLMALREKKVIVKVYEGEKMVSCDVLRCCE